MVWRSAIVAGYIALAIAVGIAYGGRGLVILSFAYFWAAAWVVFLLAWGWAAHAAGRWNYRRVDSVPSQRERNGSRPGEGEAEAGEHHELGVERHPLPAPHAKRHQPAPVFSAPS